MGMIHFLPRGKVQYRCKDCNNSEDITLLVEEVRQHGVIPSSEVLATMDSDLYLAWKVLVLATNEYDKGGCAEHDIIVRAVEGMRR